MTEKLNPRHTSQKERAAAIKALWQTASKNILNSELYPTGLWNLIQTYAEEKLKQCRPEFDVNHTHGVVYWAYELAKLYNNNIEEQQSANDEAIDLLVLISAAWLHDIGYYGQFTEVADYKAVQEKKADHMEDGALMAKEFLSTRATKFLSTALSSLGFKIFPSLANNLFVRIPNNVEMAVFTRFLSQKSISVVEGSSFAGFDNSFFRLSVRNVQTNRRFVSLMRELLEKN